MAEELIPPQTIREHMKGKTATVESIARAQEIYLQAQEDKESPFPTPHTYLLILARDQKTSVLDTFSVAELMEKYPQIPVKTTSDIGIGKIALPMDMILNNLKSNLRIANEAGYDLEKTGEEVSQKASSVLGKIAEMKSEELDRRVFQAMEKSGAIPSELAKKIQQIWWETIIPNLVTSKLLKETAVKREPGLSAKKGVSQ